MVFQERWDVIPGILHNRQHFRSGGRQGSKHRIAQPTEFGNQGVQKKIKGMLEVWSEAPRSSRDETSE
jgi:hypothetical protein